MTLKEIKTKITELKGSLDNTINSDNSGVYTEISFWGRKLRNQIKANREYNRKKLIKKLFKNIAKDIPSDIPTELRINADDNYSKCYSFVNYYNFKNKITLSLIGLKERIKWGYSNDYYSGRHEKLAFVLHNKKLALRFILLHELGHTVMRKELGLEEMHKSKEVCEKFADDFAIEQLKKQGLLK
jgi:hypothetical protein